MARYDIEYDNSGIVNIGVDEDLAVFCLHQRTDSQTGGVSDYACCPVDFPFLKKMFDAGDTLKVCDEKSWNRDCTPGCQTITITNIVPMGDPLV